MKKIFLNAVFVLSVLLFASCNNDLGVDTPTLAGIPKLSVNPVLRPTSACTFKTGKIECDFNILSDSKTDVRYRVSLKSATVPTSVVLSSAPKISLEANTAFPLYIKNLIPNSDYVFYAISVNVDGTRSEEITMVEFKTPNYTDDSKLAEIDADFTNAKSFSATPTFKADANTAAVTYPTKSVVMTKVSPGTYQFDSIWGDFYSSLVPGNTTRPYPATIKIDPVTYKVAVTYDAALLYARPASTVANVTFYDPCTKTLKLGINWGSTTNPSLNNSIVNVEIVLNF